MPRSIHGRQINCTHLILYTTAHIHLTLHIFVELYTTHFSQAGSVHFLFAVLRCGIVFLLRFVISTVIQLSDVHSIHIYLAVLFSHNCCPIYSLTL